MEEQEEGQIPDFDTPKGGTYDPAYEWPGDEDGDSETYQSSRGHSPSPGLKPGYPVFRLVALTSSILHPRQKIAVLDAYPEIQIGRDKQQEGSPMPRVRLKELAVSKLHATLYWDGARREWNIVDMGSMHGTFVLVGPVNPDDALARGAGTRLSQPRVAGVPRRLRHSDRLTIGGTTFEVHIHTDQRPCDSCAVTGKEEISLFPSNKAAPTKRTSTQAGLPGSSSASPYKPASVEDPKKALNMLKRSLLTRHGSAPTQRPTNDSTEYIDRSARRRLLHPTRDTPPGMAVPTPPGPSVTTITPPEPVATSWEPPPKVITSEPPTPLPASNIGHKLLLQQGWTPGTALGDLTASPADSDIESNSTASASIERVGLIQPLEVKHQHGRAGLGMKSVLPTAMPALDDSMSWKEREKLKRFQSAFQ